MIVYLENPLTSPLEPLTAQRLAFTRFLYEQGLAQAGQPDPLSASAVLSFHDAVETFLRLAAEHLKVNLPTSINFADYWGRLQPHLPGQVELPSKNPMDRMNKLRVQLKHHGTIPSRTAIDQARGDVTTFFTDATQLIFGIGFATVDLIDMVTRKETVQALRDAQTHADAGDYIAAMAGLVIAFDDMVDHYSSRHFGYGDPFSFGPTLHEINRHSRPETSKLRPEDLVKHVAAITTVAREMQRAMRMIALGIDYRRYVQFNILTPAVHGTMDGTTHITFNKAQEELTNQEDYQTCKRFVIESALQAAQADAALDARARHDQVNRPEPGHGWTPSHRIWTGPATTPDTSSS